MTKAKLTEWQKEVFYAAAVLIDLADQPGYATEILSEAGLSGADCSGLDEYEKERLQSVKNRLGLKGLG
ncbi:hypothetical protein [Aeromonas dhakensis]|uniref:hypothetical protein n=1 Tax=Aeromonas dhakensis TaxID=196024 RepID=UPI002B4A31E5|nr:hypothetical protein [Aeromonas dhakensis]